MIFRYSQQAENLDESQAQAEYTFLFKNELTPDEVLKVTSEVEKYNLEVLYAPFKLGSLNLDAEISNLPSNRDVTPATDDRPFFYMTDRSIGLLLLAVIAALLLLTVLFIIAPIAVSQKMDFNKKNIIFLIYFFFIGVGYILIEATFIQKLVLFLGRPSHAFQVVLFTMLVFSGIGSMLTGIFLKREEKVPRTLKILLAIIFLVIFLYSMGLGTLIEGLIHLEQFTKILLTIAILAPPALIMGMAFPLGLRMVSATSSENVIWMYGVNSSGSVLASIIGMYVALLHGFSASLILGSLMYLACLFIMLVWGWVRN
jgi:hypothetical protein